MKGVFILSLNTKTIEFQDGSEVQLRLTSSALLTFVKNYGVKGTAPIVCVMEAVESNFEAKIALLKGALDFPGNKNSVPTGAALLDKLADEGYGRDEDNALILDLCVKAGLVSAEDYQELLNAVTENGRQMVRTLAGLLTGKAPEAAAPAEEPQKGNPTGMPKN